MLHKAINELNDNTGVKGRFTYGLIIRSNAVNSDVDTIINEAASLISEYNRLVQTAVYGTFYTKLYEESLTI